MNLLNVKSGMGRTVFSVLLAMIATLNFPYHALAAPSSNNQILILNSFDENNPWMQEYINGFVYYLVNVKGVPTNVRHLNCDLIDNDSTFNEVVKENLDYFTNNPPAGVIILGRPAFAARDEINKRWNNIPMLYLAVNQDVIPKEYEFDGLEISDAPVATLHDIRDRYNFTFVRIQDHYKQTVDMMMKMQPQIKNFKFASNTLSTSLQVRDSIKSYLRDKYPHVTFEWISSDAGDGKEKLKKALSKRDLETGILMGNWYHVSYDDAGFPVYSAGDVNLVNNSPQPVFTIKENYFKTGVIGGVLPIREEVLKKSKAVIDRMLKGNDMRQIPLDKGDRGGPCIDYPQLAKKGLQDSAIPMNTSFINRPESYFKKNPLVLAVGLLVFISLVQLVMYYFLFKGKTETFMKQREIKINHLPVNYFIGKVNYNAEGEPVQVETTPGNQKAIELWEKHAGECRCEPLFNEADMLKAISKLTDDGKGVVYTEHFLKTDSYYEVNIHKGFEPDTLEIFCFNITQRIKSEENLKYTTALLGVTLDLAQIVPLNWNLNENRIVLKYNDVLRKLNRNLCSTNGEDIVISEEILFSLVHPDDLEKVKEITRDIKIGNRNYAQMEFRILIPDGNEKVEEWLEVNESVERYDDEGRPQNVVGSFACITERKEQMRRLIEARESAKEADRLKSAFLANMSHEIRTPLNAIVGFSNMLAETDDPELKQKFIGIIESNNEMLLQIISDILDLSKTEAGTMEFNMRPTDINALLVNIGESVVDRVNPGVDLICNFGAQCCWIETDPNRLSQVVINFLTNASKFTENGSISFGYEVRGENLYFFCKDTGSGISEENQKKVFERFIKLNSFVNGTGLGLPICKAIVEFLGGQIGVHSDGEGYGSTFWFEIPYRAVAVPDDVEAVIWTEPTLDLTLQHALSMPENHVDPHNQEDQAHVDVLSDDHILQQDDPQFSPQGMPPYDPQLGPEGMPPYDPQFGPQGMPPYDPQFGPQGMPPYDPQFGPEGMPPYDPQFSPQGMPPYDPQFGPQGMPPYDPHLGPQRMPPFGPQLGLDGMPLETLKFDDESELQITSDLIPAVDVIENSEVADNSEEETNLDDEAIDAAEVADIADDNDNNTDNYKVEPEDMSQQMNPNQPIGSGDPQNQGHPNNGQVPDPTTGYYQNPYGQQYPQQNPYGQQYPQHNPYGQQYPQQNPYGQQYPQQNPYGQQYPQQNPYGQQYPQQNPYGQQYPQHNPYGQQYPQQNPYGQQYPQQNPYGQQYPQQNPYGQQHPQQNPSGQQHPQHNPYGQQYPQQNPYGQQYPQQNQYGLQYPQQNPYGQQYPQQNPYGQQYPQGNQHGNQQAQQGAFVNNGAVPVNNSQTQQGQNNSPEMNNSQGTFSAEREDERNNPSSANRENNANNSNKLKVLIAEDNESNYILYESMLGGQYELIHAWNGVEAVELFEQTNPDIILMDISMPKMDGYEATTEIKRMNSNVPVIAVTAYAFATDKERMMESGFNGYVSKPINLNRLKEEMNYVLKHK